VTSEGSQQRRCDWRKLKRKLSASGWGSACPSAKKLGGEGEQGLEEQRGQMGVAPTISESATQKNGKSWRRPRTREGFGGLWGKTWEGGCCQRGQKAWAFGKGLRGPRGGTKLVFGPIEGVGVITRELGGCRGKGVRDY